MKTIEMSDATASLSHYAAEVDADPIIVTRGGKPVAALVSIADTDWETLRLSTHPDFLALLEESRESLRTEGGLSMEEMRRRLDPTD
jgi:prevent-host-death family protein